MDNKFQNGYEQIKISDKLEAVVLTAIKKAEIVKKRKKIKTKILKLSIAVASILIIFITSVNVSPIFAQSVKTLPVVGGIVKYFEVYLAIPYPKYPFKITLSSYLENIKRFISTVRFIADEFK